MYKKPSYWRACAVDARKLAVTFRTDHNKQAMFTVADHYDRRAAEEEARIAGKPPQTEA